MRCWHWISIASSPLIRITTQQDTSRTVVIIDGRLAAADLEEVQRVRQSLPSNVILNLSGLDVCADDGIRLLRDWLKNGAQLLNATPFMRMMLVGPATVAEKHL